ncbi:hypothetical protein CCP3SC1AL1_1010004 [Gammaproteobacteria bacterium]
MLTLKSEETAPESVGSLSPIIPATLYPDVPLKPYNSRIEHGRTLKVEPAYYHKQEDVIQWWRKLEQATGWAQFSDANVWFKKGNPSREYAGILISAEIWISETSYHLRPNEVGWIATKLTSVPDPNGVIEIRTLMHSIKGFDPLTYEVAWDGKPLRPISFRLTYG